MNLRALRASANKLNLNYCMNLFNTITAVNAHLYMYIYIYVKSDVPSLLLYGCVGDHHIYSREGLPLINEVWLISHMTL